MLIKKIMASFTGMVALFSTVITSAGCGTDYGVVPSLTSEDHCCAAFSEEAYENCINSFRREGICNPEPMEAIYGPPSMMCCISLQNDAEAYQNCVDDFERTQECHVDTPSDPTPSDPVEDPTDPQETIYGPPSMMCCNSLRNDAEAYQNCVDDFERTQECHVDTPSDPTPSDPVEDPTDPQETIYGPPSMMCCNSLRNDAEAYQKCVDEFEETGECKPDE